MRFEQARKHVSSRPKWEKSQAVKAARTKVLTLCAGAEQLVLAMKSKKLDGAKGLRYLALNNGQLNEEEPMNKAKQFQISEIVVREAFDRVKANKGAAGIDGQSVEAFEQELEKNLYRVWNRMSSGTYFPSPVRRVQIPKATGGTRMLGIPTVEDRVAMMVAKMYLEPEVDKLFHPDSYGYRPGRSALQAIDQTRQRCFKYAWVIDLDIKAFFDSIDHKLTLELLRRHTSSRWILLYIERWLKAKVQLEDGSLVDRDCGSPQGSVISPLISNIYLHHALDKWMAVKFPHIPFARYADDVVLHCVSEAQAKEVLSEIVKRLAAFKLEVHPEKTKIVYCKTANRTGQSKNLSFDFLGYTFRPRSCINSSGKIFLGYGPGMSNKAGKRIREEIKSWKLHLRSGASLHELAKSVNAQAQGWINYYGRFNKRALQSTLAVFNKDLIKWATRKYKRFKHSPRKVREWLIGIAESNPNLFAHWKWGCKPYVLG
jgi:RNA-directed DNA polymerase